MKTMVSVKSEQNPAAMLHLVKTSIDHEMSKLELAVELAHKRLEPFETKYQVTSEEFLARFAAEDLEGGDAEYVCWAGEYRLQQRLLDKLAQLRNIEYAHPGVFQSNQERTFGLDTMTDAETLALNTDADVYEIIAQARLEFRMGKTLSFEEMQAEIANMT